MWTDRSTEASERDPTFRAVLWTAGESCERLGAHDVYEPVVLSRVYFLLDRVACQIKIGYTERSVKSRLRAHERQRGRRLELLGTLSGSYDLERALHGRFRAFRRERHEWYSSEIAADVLALLEGVA